MVEQAVGRRHALRCLTPRAQKLLLASLWVGGLVVRGDLQPQVTVGARLDALLGPKRLRDTAVLSVGTDFRLLSETTV